MIQIVEKGDNMVCHFCKKKFERNKEQGLPQEESIVYEDDNIYVMPDISPLIVGHMLIVSKKHYQGYANAGKETMKSIKKFLDIYEKKIGNKSYTIFEHGAVRKQTAGASIDHAHFHIVPLRLDFKKELEMEFPKNSQCSLEELLDYAVWGQPYLYFKRGKNEEGYIFQVGEIKSQYLRDIGNRKIDKKNNYNWKECYQGHEAYMAFWKTLMWWKSQDYPMTFKWKKKRILEKYNLINFKELLNDTCRFAIKDYDMLIKMVTGSLRLSKDYYYRLILVPINHKYKLPNYIVYDEEGIQKVKEFVASYNGYSEIWLYNDKKEKDEKCFSGRISYNWKDYVELEFVEIVSADSPRQIENYTIKERKMDYLRLRKTKHDAEYQIEDIYAGIKYKDLNEWEKIFNYVRKMLGEYHTQLCLFKTMVKKYGINSLSLEFRVIDGQFQFIDWDTSNDERIIKNENI